MSENDIDAVIDILKSGFPEDTHAYMTCTQRGFGAFLGVAAQYPYPRSDRLQLVATGSDDVAIGFAEFKIDRKRSEALLSYVSVDAKERGKGLARKLIKQFMDSQSYLKNLSLDVFDDNLPARRLYDSLGFEELGSTTWLARNVVPREVERFVTDGLERSLAMHDRYGFCVLDTNGPEGATSLGVLGNEVVRCFDADSFNSDAIALRPSTYFSGVTRAFASLPAGTEAHPDAKVIRRVNRLSHTIREGA